MSQNIAIIGANGAIGQAITAQLSHNLPDDARIHAFARKQPQTATKSRKEPLTT